MKRSSPKKRVLTYVSLFSGAGVGCYGFKQERFDCIATVEIIKRRLEIQKYNSKCKYSSGYISDDLTKSSTKEKVLSEINFWRERENLKEVDVVLATPPCQGMSVANHKKKNESARNSLVVESIRLINEIRPRFFVLENVRVFLNTLCVDVDGKAKPIREAVELNLGGHYNIHYQVINFKDYGNPSSRTRTLAIGVRKDIPEVTPLDLMPALKSGGTVRQAIADLPSLEQMGEIYSPDVYHQFRPYAIHMRDWVTGLKEGESAFDNSDLKKRPHQVVDGKLIFNENKNGDKYTRAFWDRSGPCIHTRNDILASQVTIHPVDDRVFSVRELMRLMSIPDNFRWSDISFSDLNKLPQEEKQQFLKKNEINIRQSIGEAVPTTIFRQIARNIRKISERPGLDDATIIKLINEKGLRDLKKLRTYLILNLSNYRYWELAKILELANAKRTNLAAYYTRQDICFTLVKDLPDASKFEKLKILEPSVGAGNFLPLLIEKYKTVSEVEIDLVDIDVNALDLLKQLFRKLRIPANVKLNFIHADFLTHDSGSLFEQNKRYDIIVGNPPYGTVPDRKTLAEYKRNVFNTDTNNLFSFFLEKCLGSGRYIALIIPKAFLSATEFNRTRELVSNFRVQKITDYGEKGFKGVKIETISLIVDAQHDGDRTLVESYVKNEIGYKRQSYICSKEFPYWLVYRNDFFDSIAKKLHFNIFVSYRDRQITKKITRTEGTIRVLKSRNIGNNKIVNIPNYDSYVDSTEGLSISKYLNKTKSVLVPNLTYAPRAAFLPNNAIVDGSVAVLTPKTNELRVSKSDLEYFATPEFTEFYKVARNFGTRSLNIDSNSVFFFGISKR